MDLSHNLQFGSAQSTAATTARIALPQVWRLFLTQCTNHHRQPSSVTTKAKSFPSVLKHLWIAKSKLAQVLNKLTWRLQQKKSWCRFSVRSMAKPYTSQGSTTSWCWQHTRTPLQKRLVRRLSGSSVLLTRSNRKLTRQSRPFEKASRGCASNPKLRKRPKSRTSMCQIRVKSSSWLTLTTTWCLTRAQTGLPCRWSTSSMTRDAKMDLIWVKSGRS